MTPPAGANVCRVSLTVPYTTTSASAARSETVICTHEPTAGEDATTPLNSTAGVKIIARRRPLTRLERSSGRGGSLGGLAAKERAQPIAEGLEDRNGNQGVLPDHVVE